MLRNEKLTHPLSPFPSVFGVVDIDSKEESPEIGGEVPEEDPGLHNGSSDCLGQVGVKVGGSVPMVVSVESKPVHGSCYHSWKGERGREGGRDGEGGRGRGRGEKGRRKMGYIKVCWFS